MSAHDPCSVLPLPFGVRLCSEIRSRCPAGYVAWIGNDETILPDELASAVSERLPSLVPSEELCSWSHRTNGWYDFERRYRLELNQHPETCSRLADLARSDVLWLIAAPGDTLQRSVRALKNHLDELEAERRYRAGWVIGGHALPVQREILALGGLWLPRHRAWTLPDHAAWEHIQQLLPGEF